MVSLSDFTSVDSVLAILSILIGLTIFAMQQRADEKINGIIKTQFRRQQLEKKYFGARIISNLRLVQKNYSKLEHYLEEYLKEHSQAAKFKAKTYSSFQTTSIDGFLVPSLRDDLARLIEFIDDLDLIDQLSLTFDDLSAIFKDCSVDSMFEESDSAIRGKIESARKQAELIESLLSRFTKEIPTSFE